VFPGLIPRKYTIRITNSLGCINETSITIDAAPGAPIAPTVSPTVTYCQNATATALTATGSGLLWYSDAAGGSGTSNAPIPSTATEGSIDYYVSQVVGGCESPRSKITVTVKAAPPIPTVTTPIAVCQNASAPTLTATGTSLVWYTTATSTTGSSTVPTVSTATAGPQSFFVSQTVGGCESAKAAITVNITATPTAVISYAGNPFTNVVATVLPTISGTQGGTFSVNPITGLIINNQTGAINTGISKPGTYTITYQFSANGCNGVATTSVTINTTNTEIFIPNTFTPNGDSKNDVFLIYGNSIQTIDMKVFNQWGQVVFETNSQLKGWDGTIGGKKQPSGVYIYAAKIVLTDGTTITKKGSINLIR
jgi:gliding motility-associated-like protein